jgi:hypothetical protein
MRNKALFNTIAAGVLALGLSVAAQAQGGAQNPAPQTDQKPAAKPHKVWTSDDLGTLRAPADVYLENEQKKADEEAAAAKQAAANKQAANATPTKKVQPPRLSNPKTAQSAEEMIAWEDRDLQAQTEYVAQVRQQLAEAPPEDKPRLEKVIQEREQVIAQIRQEKAGLAAQKQALEKK